MSAVFIALCIAAAQGNGAVDDTETHLLAARGLCGNNITWTFDPDTGTLTLEGNGTMYNYVTAASIPWYSSASSILNVVMEKGITSIGDFAFSSCKKFNQCYNSKQC